MPNHVWTARPDGQFVRFNEQVYAFSGAMHASLPEGVLACTAGIAAALSRNGWIDTVSRIVSLVGLSFPAFVSGISMPIAFAIQLGWLPVLGNMNGSGDFAARMHALALPAVNLVIIMMAYVTRAVHTLIDISRLNTTGGNAVWAL
jgi:ABC-type dipeptide/oligopeptide/nickel transport system permease component